MKDMDAMTPKGPPSLFTKTFGTAAGVEMVWLHGWGHDHKILEPLADLFKRKGKMVLFDLPGFGQTPMLPRGAGTDAYADLLIEELRTRNKATRNTRRILVGHSFGCRVAIRLAAKAPELVDGLIFIAGAGIPRKRSVLFRLRSSSLKILGRTASFADRLFKTNWKQAFRNRFGSRDYRNAGALRETFVATVTENLSEISKTVKTPVLLLYGSEDTETPVEVGEAFVLVLPNAKLMVLNGFGHLDILTKGKHQCQHYINSFLGGQS